MISKVAVLFLLLSQPGVTFGRLNDKRKNLPKETTTVIGDALAKIECGSTFCGVGEYCCNPSCGICASEGESCTMMACAEETKSNYPSAAPSAIPSDRATVIGDAVAEIACGSNVCGVGEYCCNPSCGMCAAEGEVCITMVCDEETKSDYPSVAPSHLASVIGDAVTEIACGSNICGVGEYCCNSSCGICAAEGDPCITMICDEETTSDYSSAAPSDVATVIGDVVAEISCGSNICGVGEYCCNPSCGICALEGESCIMMACSSDETKSDYPSAAPSDVATVIGDAVAEIACGSNVCGVGEYCCNESCGICAKEGDGCVEKFCFDETENDETNGTDAVCGSAICKTGEYCCNESCGICAKEGEGCTEAFCDPRH